MAEREDEAREERRRQMERKEEARLLGEEGENPIQEGLREGLPGPAIPPRVQNVGENPPVPNAIAPDAMLLLTNLLVGQREQQLAQQQLQVMQAKAPATAVHNLAQRETMPGRANRKLPTFSADEGEEVDDWVHAVNAEALAGG